MSQLTTQSQPPATRNDLDWWRSAVIYQIYPRSFVDSNGDGIGDLPGIVQKLDYIASLGVDAIWVSPFFKSPMKDFGYDIADYCAVEPMFGDMADFETLLNRAHALDLRVLIDQVWNHTSDQHPWFVESRQSRDNPKADWYVWADAKPDGSPPTNWRATFGGSAWEWDDVRQQYYLHNFLVSQPDLNWYNPEVVEAILEVARFWLDLGVDGFRLDVANFYTHDRQLRDNPPRPKSVKRPAGASPSDPYFDFINTYNFCRPETLDVLKAIRQQVDRYPGATTLAEISSAEDTIATSSEYVATDDRLHMAYNSALVSDDALLYRNLKAIIQQAQAAFGDRTICWTGGTHDFPRMKSRWRKFLIDDTFTHEVFDHLFAALLVSLRGSCCIYQGDELGLTQAEIPFEQMQDPFGLAGYPGIKGRDGARTPMPWQADVPHAGFTTAIQPWLPVPAEHYERAVNRQEAVSSSLLNKYRALIYWRKQQPALLQGDLELLEPETAEPVLALRRRCETQQILCLFNLSPMPVHFDLSAYPECQQMTASTFVNRYYSRTVELPAYGVFFGELAANSPQ